MVTAHEFIEDGAVVLHCGHLNALHYRAIKAHITFTRPDGTTGTAHYRFGCHACLDAHGGKFDCVPVRGDGVWKKRGMC